MAAFDRTLNSDNRYITQFVEGAVPKDGLEQVRKVSKGHPSLQRQGIKEGLRFIDTGTSVDKYVDDLHGIYVRGAEDAIPRGVWQRNFSTRLMSQVDTIHLSESLQSVEHTPTTLMRSGTKEPLTESQTPSNRATLR